jgi:opacity protein-like surface antigen
MRKKIVRSILIACMSFAVVKSYAQPAIPREYIEHPGYSLGINFGWADLWGDVGTKSMMDHYNNPLYLNKPCFMGGIMGRLTAHPMFAMRFGVNYGTVYATDAWNKDLAKTAKSIEDDAFQRYLRNQDARANIWELSYQVELIPFRANSESKIAAKRLQPYLTFGLAAFSFKPQTSLIDPVTRETKWVNTRDLHLEGEGIEYEVPTPGHSKKTNKWAFAIPVGAGLRMDINKNFAIGLEWLLRITTEDRLDGVSSEYVTKAYLDKNLSPDKAETAKLVYDKSWAIDPNVEHGAWTKRGNKDNKDKYSTVSLTFIYKLKRDKTPWWY